MRKAVIKIVVLALATMIILSGCSSDEDNKMTEEEILKSNFLEAGYEVKEHIEIAGIVGIRRIAAVKEDIIMEVCYKVKKEDCEIIDTYYADNYPSTYIGGYDPNKGIVYYASDKAAWKISEFDVGFDRDDIYEYKE